MSLYFTSYLASVLYAISSGSFKLLSVVWRDWQFIFYYILHSNISKLFTVSVNKENLLCFDTAAAGSFQ